MKIAFCIGSLEKGGAERVISNLANYFCELNDVSIICLKNKENQYSINQKIKMYKIDSKDRKNMICRTLNRFKKLKNILINENYDAIISFLPVQCFYTLYLKKYTNSKVIISIRNDPKVEYSTKINKFLMKRLYPLADGVVFQTNDAKKYFEKIMKCNQRVIMNSINPVFIKERYSGIREKKIVAVGRLSEQKNHKLLIDAFANIQKFYPNYKVYIYGEGHLKNELQNYINNKELDEKIYLMGNSDNIENEIYKADLFVMTSNYEGMPNALIEAMSLGVPCISSDCPIGGPGEIINDGENGLLFDVGNQSELEKKIIEILDNDKLRNKISINASKIQERLNPQKVNSEWEMFVKEILKNEYRENQV